VVVLELQFFLASNHENLTCRKISGLQKYLDNLGFNLIGYGCTTCIGNSGELDEDVAKAITDNGNFILTNLSQLSNFFLLECTSEN
jgi:aconitase A